MYSHYQKWHGRIAGFVKDAGIPRMRECLLGGCVTLPPTKLFGASSSGLELVGPEQSRRQRRGESVKCHPRGVARPRAGRAEAVMAGRPLAVVSRNSCKGLPTLFPRVLSTEAAGDADTLRNTPKDASRSSALHSYSHARGILNENWH